MTSRVRFADDILEAPADFGKKRRLENLPNDEEGVEPSTKKHTLDSDEEDDDRDKYEKLDVKKVEGQEEATDEYDGKIKLMPFNMKEDMEEGHFDKDGNFIYDKKEDQIKDEWLDNINWENVKNKAGQLWQKSNEESEELNDENAKMDLRVVYKRLLEILRPNEDIGKTMKRLNSEKGLTLAEQRKRRWAAKKAGAVLEDESSKTVAELTALADSLISMGHMEAYQLDNAQLNQLLNEMEPKVVEKVETQELDMFGDELPSSSSSIEASSETSTSSSTTTNPDPTTISSEKVTMWEYRFAGENSTLHGPTTNSKMLELVHSTDQFNEGGQARRVGTDHFYDVKRIDFELYE